MYYFNIVKNITFQQDFHYNEGTKMTLSHSVMFKYLYLNTLCWGIFSKHSEITTHVTNSTEEKRPKPGGRERGSTPTSGEGRIELNWGETHTKIESETETAKYSDTSRQSRHRSRKARKAYVWVWILRQWHTSHFLLTNVTNPSTTRVK